MRISDWSSDVCSSDLQATGAGTTFLRWRNLDRSSMGVALWEALLANPATPASLIDELYAMELQRIVLNMQISLTHSIARQALECASKAAQAEAIGRASCRERVCQSVEI